MDRGEAQDLLVLRFFFCVGWIRFGFANIRRGSYGNRVECKRCHSIICKHLRSQIKKRPEIRLANKFFSSANNFWIFANIFWGFASICGHWTYQTVTEPLKQGKAAARIVE
ncbi:hypothetical protein AV649_08415 [Rossellomorea marisflavi]|uniref:Uncharacterized protein n=1 Tax=Rossellomorea marisflavi TaxID=189381 RepID=A0A161T3K1_9BACI|nr:hypothetical protein AV649_08415 [Rossellomorea marisflavi]